MCGKQNQKIITYNDLITLFQDVTFGPKMDEIIQYISDQGKPLIPQSEVIGKILADLGLGTNECITAAMAAFKLSYEPAGDKISTCFFIF